MSATIFDEPYQIPAGLLALLVHGLFFAWLYFGFTWQAQPVETVSVELWQSLPEEEIAPPVLATPVEATPPPQQSEPLVKPEIVLPDKDIKKKVEEKPVVIVIEKPKVVVKPSKAIEIKPLPKVPVVQKPTEAERRASMAAQQAEQAARDKAAQDAAIDAVVNEYQAKIKNKIRRNIVKPPDVPDDALAEFSVTLLPDGSVLSQVLKKPSGNAAYDSAVERAILKSQPLPLPPDAALFKKFRDLKLKFKPVE